MTVRPSMPTDRSASAPSTPLSSRRLISRITSPFGPKSRSITDYCIEVDDQYKQYSPGDTVSGSVKLRVVKPVRVTHLVVCLHGFVQVYKNPGAPPADGYRANGAYLGTGRGKKSGEYFGNGFASLFEDEVVLCGDGRLGEGVYQFNFNLEFPDRDLPSSIDFERGTISYMITATLTRPTTISPTLQWDRKVFLVERIDISKLNPPKARTITLEPLSRRTRARHQARKFVDPSLDRRSRHDDSNPNSNDRRGSQASSSPSTRADGEPPRSPAPSEISFESLGSASQQESTNTSGRNSESARANCSKISLPMKTITATVQSLAGGCLRGDNIPIKIVINHTKHMKSLYGVIITLYRQARVDLHPAIPLGPTEKGKESKFEDYYPKSLTGLGGLSLSGAGSSHVFRKDLAQVMLPLIVDPRTLTAEINGKIRIPEESFPTISTVPGSMISFRYYIEVVLDIQGKLSSTDRNLGNLGGFASTRNPAPGVDGADQDRAAYPAFGSPMVDTVSIRRDKGVVACTFEVIVGTKDSARRLREKKPDRGHSTDTSDDQQPTSRRPSPPDHQPWTSSDAPAHNEQWTTTDGAEAYADQQNYHYTWYDHRFYEPGYEHYGYNSAGQAYLQGPHGYSPSAATVPMPEIEDESQLSEKERLRRAEARLLPSQPPIAEDEAGENGFEATAPFLPDDQYTPYPNGHEERSVPLIVATPAGATGSSFHAGPSNTYYDMTARTPDYEPRQQPGLPVAKASGAGEEPHRRSLNPSTEQQAQEGAASPSPAPVEAGVAAVEAQQPASSNLEDDGLYEDVNDSHADASASLGLPRYEQ